MIIKYYSTYVRLCNRIKLGRINGKPTDGNTKSPNYLQLNFQRIEELLTSQGRQNINWSWHLKMTSKWQLEDTEKYIENTGR